jgi:hypothetical protein
MRHPTCVLVLLLPAAAVLASAEPGSDDTERNARLVERYRRDDPAYYERLRRDLRAFYRLPAEKRERLRRLDRALQEQDSATQRRLWEVLDRFSAWLDRLPDDDRRRVEEAPTRAERLRVISELREQEFVRRLPKAVRQHLDQLSAEMRALQLARLRVEERQMRQAWDPDGRHGPRFAPAPDRPVRAADLSPEALTYLREVLTPMMSEKDKSELKAADGKWPLYARTLLDLAEKHPVVLPGTPAGPTSVKDLRTGDWPDARAVYQRVTKGGTASTQEAKHLRQLEGKWPDFARELTRLAHKHMLPIKPFGPCRPDEFLPVVQAFIRDDLAPQLTAQEKVELEKAQGLWPDYPEKLRDLSRAHNLEVPMMKLPGARRLWDKVREVAELPEVPDRTLREFFVTELSEKDRAGLRLSLDDPDSRDRLRQEYFKRNPKALNRLRDLDRRKAKNTE